MSTHLLSFSSNRRILAPDPVISCQNQNFVPSSVRFCLNLSTKMFWKIEFRNTPRKSVKSADNRKWVKDRKLNESQGTAIYALIPQQQTHRSWLNITWINIKNNNAVKMPAFFYLLQYANEQSSQNRFNMWPREISHLTWLTNHHF